MAASVILDVIKTGAELFRGVHEGKVRVEDAIASQEAALLAADVEIAKQQAEIAKIDAKSDKVLQWAWRPMACIGLTLASLTWPMATILDTTNAVDLTDGQLENLRLISNSFLPYLAGAMGLRELGKYHRGRQ